MDGLTLLELPAEAGPPNLSVRDWTGSGGISNTLLPDGSGADLHSEFAAELGLTRWLLMCDFEDDPLLYKPMPNVPRPLFLDKPFSLHQLNELFEAT